MQLWHAGFMHADEVKGKTGQIWLGLFETATGFELRRTKITVRDSANIVESDKFVVVDQPTKPIFLVRGGEGLKEGPVSTVYFGRFELSPMRDILLGPHEKSYFGLASTAEMGEDTIHNYEIAVRDGHTRQNILRRDPFYGDGIPELQWAGDLDRDGKIDLLLDLRIGYNESRPTLFLSSKAEPGELVGKVAWYVSIGC